MRDTKGITLVALVITIIILLILSGVTISLTLGENGLVKRSEGAKGEYTKSSIKEELEMDISNLLIEKRSKGEILTKQEIAEELGKKTEIFDVSDTQIDGEYKDYTFIVDENNKVIVGEELKGARPTGKIIILEQGETEAEMQVIASTTEGEIASLESMDGLTPKLENSNSDKIYKITKNGEYRFKITGTNGRVVIIKEKISSIAEFNDIFSEIEKIKDSGVKQIDVIGKQSNGTIEKVQYSLNVINNKGNVVLDGVQEILGVVPSNSTYEFGSAEDVATASENAKNIVVLKVEGDLTINAGVILTTVKSDAGYGGPKGMIIYCTGKLTNNGIISMTERGAKAVGQNVYLLGNNDGSYEYVPSQGATGRS